METVKLTVEVSEADSEQIAKRIEMLEGVQAVGEDFPEEEFVSHSGGADMLVFCGHGARRMDVEDLLHGVNGVTVKMLK